VDAILRFFSDHRLATTSASVLLVLGWVLLQRVRTVGTTPTIDDLVDSEVEEGVEADGDPGAAADRLDREEDAGQER
jgi:hypothetical protein